jgi:FkbM family methyltransferase
VVEDLIYDVGMNDGSDTAYYLHQGYRVVAIEANPLLIEQARERFAAPLASGRLTLLNVGVAAEAGVFPFWVNDAKPEWSAFDREVASRLGTSCRAVDVQALPFGQILAQYGVPYYLKVDIEGHDYLCLEALDPRDLPRYLSVEAHQLEYLCRLSTLGYNAFKCVAQKDHNDPLAQSRRYYAAGARGSRALKRCQRRLGKWLRRDGAASAGAAGAASGRWHFPPGSSGPFAEQTPGPWRELKQVVYDWLHFDLGHTGRTSLNPRTWHDFHATIK